MQQLDQIKHWFNALQKKEQWMLSATGVLLFATLFYLAIWEPIHLDLKAEQQKQQSQTEILFWMQQAAADVSVLRATGSRNTLRDTNKPVTLIIEQAINNAGLKPYLRKIESSGTNAARVTLSDASFNQILVWLNTLAKHNGIQVVSANIERADGSGRADARLTLERS